jgi:hypothetical protein
MMWKRFGGTGLAAFAICGMWTQSARAQADLTGFWERKDAAGSGSFGGLDAGIPRASLLDTAANTGPGRGGPQLPVETQPHAVGTPYIVTTGQCSGAGMPFMMGHSAALDILQSKDEILMIPEMPGVRHIFMDGREHPASAIQQPTSTGHSVGHWEGDVLVVDTVGLEPGGGVPGGGRKAPATHLTERMRLLDGGKRLSITFTWSDPKIYAKPHTYEYTYYKDPADTYAFEEWCDSSDPLQKQSIVPPPQK